MSPLPSPSLRTARTQSELAAQLGLSVSTVAKALAGDAKVAAKTRARVEAAARELGYQPNPAASLMARLRHRRKASAALQIRAALLGASRETMAVRDWEQVCEEAGVDGLAEVWPKEGDPARFLEQLWHQGVSGLLLWMEGFPAWPGAAQSRVWERFSAVKLQRVRPELAFNVVRHEAFEYTLLALRKSAASARRKLCVTLMETESAEDDLARLGALLAFREKNRSGGPEIVWRFWEGPLDRADEGTLAWLLREDPDAVLFYHFIMAERLQAAGWPERFRPRCNAVLSTPGYPYLRLPLAGCDTSHRSHLGKALGLLLDMISHGQRGFPERIVEHIIEPEWVEAGPPG